MISRLLRLGFALPALVLAFTAPARAQTAAQAPATAEALPPAQQVIDRHIEALGGRKAIQSHSSVMAKGTMTVPANGMSGSMEMYAARPNKVVAKITLGGIGEMAEGFDGTVGWSSNPLTGPMLASGAELEQRAFDANFDGVLGIASRYESMKTVEKTTFEGRPVYKLVLTRKGGGDDVEFYDVETGLRAGSIVERDNPMGKVAVTTVFSDYKKFGDVMQPTGMKQRASGSEIVTTITSVEYDKVDPSVFELPDAIKALVKK